MKALSLSKHKLTFVAVLICLTMAGSNSAFAVLQKHTGKTVNTVTVVTESEISFIGSTFFQNVANATVKVTVPAFGSPVEPGPELLSTLTPPPRLVAAQPVAALPALLF